MLIFLSDTGKDVLAKSSIFYVDGTFSAVEGTFFGQLFMIVGKSSILF